MTKQGRSADAALADLGEAVHYQILKANCDTGEGELALQPWLQVEEPDLLASDLCRGWIDALEDLGLICALLASPASIRPAPAARLITPLIQLKLYIYGYLNPRAFEPAA